MGLTGCPTAAEAKQYIEMADGNLDRAASLYFDVGVGGAAVPEENVRAAIPAFRDTLLASPAGSQPGSAPGSERRNISYVRMGSTSGRGGSSNDGDTHMSEDQEEDEEFYFEEEEDEEEVDDEQKSSAVNDGEKGKSS
ncbi:conserved hypothetical protein [Perkinsus marinus ATCC 50983]|uniref:Uncharacterized protein n=1 Tax=Perkinsus marinus (strain ATCC 50983 / TXsc) TaxID=423536 RepID=C5KZ06_PERM5|nr:conserved hypothetical protein [Perkinsus marinus ATCC 50983]EER10295.1 conserved hypothetical protein [Perkinsus marinus ATCC 50983]|eukprot:XP_002778500.1 conserved hypothetical protein [Perkinsus marinus ATCC 50983]